MDGWDTAVELPPPSARSPGLALPVVRWGSGLAACACAAVLLDGLQHAMPVFGVPLPFTLSATAAVVAAVCLRCGAPWGPVLAAFVGLVADVSGPGLPGNATWAYVVVPVCCAAVHRLIRTDGIGIYAAVVLTQCVFQYTGTFVGLRLAGTSSMSVHAALASVWLTALATTVAATIVRAVVEGIRLGLSGWRAR